MTPYEAAIASVWLRLDIGIACHYTKKDCADVKEYVDTLNKWKKTGKSYVTPFAPEPGEIFEYAAGDRKIPAEELDEEE
jgi:L-ascorbate metabolism protein UlaG (beta-lactamase superfamily)